MKTYPRMFEAPPLPAEERGEGEKGKFMSNGTAKCLASNSLILQADGD